MSGAQSASVVGAGFRPSFTAAQWRELEHQALIYKYLVAGLPIPPDLLVPIRTGFESISARVFHNSSLGYSSYYGKKIDPEPGRCRRTDGKKWRCSKDAYLDSKYCERHMHRGRNRSRKPVESQSVSHSLPTAISRSATGSSSGSGSFHNLSWHSTSSDEGSLLKSNVPRWQIDPVSYGIINKDYRNIHEVKPEPNKPSTHPSGADSGSIQVLSVDQNADDRSHLMLSGIQVDSSLNYGTYLQDFESTGHTSVSRLRQQHCFLSKDIGSAGSGKESHAIRPFLDAWPKAGDSWSNLDEQRDNNTNFSSTQLSISVPVSLSENSARRACFPEGD